MTAHGMLLISLSAWPSSGFPTTLENPSEIHFCQSFKMDKPDFLGFEPVLSLSFLSQYLRFPWLNLDNLNGSFVIKPPKNFF
jgi:hypothetical protein